MDKYIKENNIIVKLICLTLSLVLWMYISNVENRVRDYKLDNIPVEILNEDILKEYKLALVPNQTLYVSLNVEGPSNEIYKIKKDQFKVVVNLANYALKKGVNNVPIEITSYPNNINIRNDSFLRVDINLDNYIEKTLPIESKINVTTEEGTYVDKAVLSPANATIMGAESEVEKVAKLVVKGEVDNINQATELQLPILPVDKSGKTVDTVTLSTTKTQVTFGVKKGKEVPIKLVTQGSLREGFMLKSIVPEVDKVELLGDEDVLSKINYIESEPIDLSQFSEDGEVSVILKVPENTSLSLEVNQIKVTVTLSKIISKEIEIPITVTGDVEGYSAELNATTIKVKIKGVQEVISAVNASDMSCEVDISGMPVEGGIVTPKITNPYDDVTVVEFSPATINVTFAKETVADVPETEGN